MSVLPKTLMVPPLWLLLALIAMVALDDGLPMVEVVPADWRWTGLLVAGLGVLQGVWAIAHFVRAQTPFHPHEEATALVTSGPYRYSRNPMYLGLLAVLVGTAIGLGSLSPWLIPPLFVAIITALFIRPEERRLAARFGEAYHTYQASVRRWL